MTTEKLNYIYDYVMDDIEYAESEAVEYAINNIFKSICVTDYLPEVVDIIDMNKYSGLNFS